MAFLTSEQEIYNTKHSSEDEAKVFLADYPEFKRLANNDLIQNLDEALPEVNDGTLAASLFKLPKRIVNSNLVGRAKSTDRDESWVSELANIVWETKIVPNANSQAPFHRKWKDAVRKAAIYGHVPLITLFVERGNYIGSDFIVGQPGDVKLEPGKLSDYDSDVFFWDVFYTKLQLKGLIKRARKEAKEESDGVNKWNVPVLKELHKNFPEEEKESDTDDGSTGKPKPKGVKFTIVFQRGVNAPFYMFHNDKKQIVREWSNPDPSGDVPVHFLYCYQDFENPYGTGIVKLAGGTQNVLDYMRQADVLATQLGFRPPVSISGDTTGLDRDSIVYAQDAQWITGQAQVRREEISNQIYSQLPNRISMYKISLNQMIPTGDTSISAGAGDQNYSKTHAGVQFQQANLSIDDEDFKDNLYQTYEAKARSMINTHFANMQGHDIEKLSDENREILAKAGLEFPTDENGDPTNELDIIWDEARAEFTFKIEAEQDKAKDEEQRLNGLLQVAQLRASDPMFDQKLMASGKRINDGELYSSIIQLTTDNDKILEDITPEDQLSMQSEQAGQMETPQTDEYIRQIMDSYRVSEGEAMAMAEAEQAGASEAEILGALQRSRGMVNA